MLQELQDIHQSASQHNSILGKALLICTGILLVVSENMPQGMQMAQIFAWIGTGIAGLATAAYYVYKTIKGK